MGFEISMAGRTALITGGGGGVGREIGLAMVRAGARVWINDIDGDRAERTAREIASEAAGEAHGVQADVTHREEIEAMREVTGPVDALVNNAGIPPGGLQLAKFVEWDPLGWEPVMRLNLGAVLHVTQVYLPGMLERRWGRVLTIVSDAGRRGERYQTIYGAAKAGAMGFARGLAAEVGQHGVTVNCIALGSMRIGPLLDAVTENPELEQKLARNYMVGRVGLPTDPAPLAVLLCSDAGEWITGQVYPVNGGYSAAL